MALRLASKGSVLVRVHGRCRGVVACRGQLRWCWGAFAHAFTVPADAREVAITAVGPFGVRRARVPLGLAIELNEPRFALRPAPAPRAARSAFGVSARARVAPRLLSVETRELARELPSPARVRSRAPSISVCGLRPALRRPLLAPPALRGGGDCPGERR